MTPGPAANFDLVVRYLREWVFPRWRSLAAVLLVTAGLAAATGGYPLIIKVSFDSLLKGDDSVLVLVLLAVVLITACRSTLMYFQNILSQQFIGRIAIDLQKLTLRRLVGLDYARLTAEAPGQSLSRVTNDVGFIANASSAALNSALKDTLSVAVLVGTMFYLDWVMSLVVLCIYPLAAWPIIKLSERLRTVARRTQSQLGNLTSLLTQIFTAPRLIKAYRLEDYVGRNASGQFEESFKLQMKALRTRARIDPMLEALGGVAVAGVIGLAYWRISGGSSTVGDFMGFVSALLMAAQPIRGLGSLAGRIQEGLVAASRVYGILDATPATVERPNAAPLNVTNGALRFDNVVFRYPGNAEPALRGLSLDIAPGTTVALVGQSGGGKSTLINLLPRLYDVSEGQILIDGQDIESVTIDSLRDAIAFVSQDVA
ncbi:MAG: ABC transporter ATP-binding protein, partial [Pseudomonadota bacterium]